MSKVRYFFLSMNVLNGLLAAAVAAAMFFTVIPFLNPAVLSLPPAKEPVEWSGEKAAPAQSSSPADYAVISEQNLFHPERKIPPEKQQEKVIPKPDLFLYGTLILDDASFAFVEDRKAPYSTAGRGKRQLTLKKGENLGGYILSEIEANRIVLVKGEDKLTVMLDDRQKRRTIEQSSALPATQRAISDGTSTFPPVVSPSPQTALSSTRAAVPPGPGIGGVMGSRLYPAPAGSVSPQSVPSAAQAVTSPVIGNFTSQTLPTTRRSKVEEMQKMRLESQQQGK